MQNIKLLIFSWLAIFFSLTLLNSCEGMRCASGYVFDAETNEPLDSVLCTVLTGSEEFYTDSTGNYSVCNNFEG